MKSIKVSAPGKIHLLGEHTVVYGKPALIAAVNKRCFVEILPHKNKKIEIIIVDNTEKKLIEYVQHAIEITRKYYHRTLTKGFVMKITSEIPMGSGMGSSAASAVAIAGAVTLFLKEKFDKEKINTIAFQIEKYNHVTPSGGDNSASCYGGFIWYRKETENVKLINPVTFQLNKELLKKFHYFNTGIPKESTREMVLQVKQFVKSHKLNAEKIFIDQEILTRGMISALQTGDDKKIISIIKKGERNLEKLGVVSSPVKKLIRQIEKAGGAAKICGGGGKKAATGILLIFKKNNNIEYNTIKLGEEGIKIHE